MYHISYLLHKDTGQYINMRRDKGVYLIDAFMNQDIGPNNKNEVKTEGFSRQG